MAARSKHGVEPLGARRRNTRRSSHCGLLGLFTRGRCRNIHQIKPDEIWKTAGMKYEGVTSIATFGAQLDAQVHRESAGAPLAMRLLRSLHPRAQSAFCQRLLASGTRDAERLTIGSLTGRRRVYGHSRSRGWGIFALPSCSRNAHDRRRSRWSIACWSAKDHWTSVLSKHSDRHRRDGAATRMELDD